MRRSGATADGRLWCGHAARSDLICIGSRAIELSHPRTEPSHPQTELSHLRTVVPSDRVFPVLRVSLGPPNPAQTLPDVQGK